MRKENGVTITALILAIILLIILAAISITSLRNGDRDTLTTAYDSKVEMEIATYQEELDIIDLESVGEQKSNGLAVTKYIDFFEEALYEDSTFENAIIERKSTTTLRIETEEGYVFIVTVDGVEFVGISGEFDETYSLTEEDVTFTYTPSYWTNENVTVEISFNFDIGDDTFQYSTDGETWYDYEEAFEVETNTEIYVMYSTYGDDYVTGEVTNIDKLLPTIDSIETTTNSLTFTASDSSSSSYGASGIVGYLVTQSSTTPTSSSSFIDCTDDEGNGVTSLETTVNELKQNTTYYVYVIDNAGNISSLSDNSYIATSIVPGLTEYNVEFTQSEDDWTNEDVIVYVDITDEDIQDDIDDGTYTLEYSIDGGETWEEYDPETGIPVDENTEIEVRLSDGDNTGESITHEVDNIDKTAPEVELEVTDTTTNSITVEVTAEDLGDDGTSENASGIASYEFQISTDGETWETVEIIETSEETYTYTYEGLTDDTTYYVRVIVTDVAGNSGASEAEEVTLGEVPGGEDPSGEYDDEGIEIPTLTFEYSTTEWTNEDVTVTIVVNGDTADLVEDGTYTIEYNTEDPTDEASWKEYTTAVTFETNGSIYARLSDGTNTGDYATGTVSNIDKTVPEAEIEVIDSTTNSITVEITAEDLGDDGTSDSSSGIASYEFQISIDGENWETVETVKTSAETYEYTYEGLTDDTTYYVRVIVTDVAGNSGASETEEVTLGEVPGGEDPSGEYDDGGIEIPTLTFEYSTTEWTNEDVTVTIVVNGDTADLVEDGTYTIEYNTEDPTDEDSWTEYIGEVVFETNGSIYARLSDGTNTGDYATGTVSNIDKLAPSVTIESTEIEQTEVTITGTAEDSEATDEYGCSGIDVVYVGVIAEYEDLQTYYNDDGDPVYYSEDDIQWFGATVDEDGNFEYTFEAEYEGIVAETAYIIGAKALDNASNESNIAESDVAETEGDYVDYSAAYEVIEDGDSTNDWRLFFITEEEYTSVYGDETISAADYTYNDEGTLVEFTTTADNQVYIIAADYILAENMPTSPDGDSAYYSSSYPWSLYFHYIYAEYTGTSKWDAQLDIWNSLYLNNYSSTYSNAKATEYLLDTDAWAEFYLDTGYTDTTFGNYVIGSPTLEMWCAAWESKGYSKLYCDKVGSYGYYVSLDGSSYSYYQYVTSSYMENSGYEDTIFVPHQHNVDVGDSYVTVGTAAGNCSGYWIASPRTHLRWRCILFLR